jgi:hypothetical protein
MPVLCQRRFVDDWLNARWPGIPWPKAVEDEDRDQGVALTKRTWSGFEAGWNVRRAIYTARMVSERDVGQVFLPFEGDRVLAVILSKAMLLAADSKITDPAITRQILS